MPVSVATLTTTTLSNDSGRAEGDRRNGGDKKFKPMVLTQEEKARPHMWTQAYAPATVLVLGTIAAHIARYCSAADFVLPLLSGYLHTDAYLAALHMWLDDPVTLDSAVPVLAKLAWEFQHHHDWPDDVFHKNHVLSIDLFVRMTGVVLLACFWLAGLAPWTLTHFISIGVWGFVGAANHVAMHARTHGKTIPYIYRFGQDVGVLMQPKHHKMHHTAPFDCYFSFLQGFNVAYTELYNRLLMHNRTLMTVFFVALQPPVTILALAGGAAISSSPLPALAPSVFAYPNALAHAALVAAFVPIAMRQKAPDSKAHAE